MLRTIATCRVGDELDDWTVAVDRCAAVLWACVARPCHDAPPTTSPPSLESGRVHVQEKRTNTVVGQGDIQTLFDAIGRVVGATNRHIQTDTSTELRLDDQPPFLEWTTQYVFDCAWEGYLCDLVGVLAPSLAVAANPSFVTATSPMGALPETCTAAITQSLDSKSGAGAGGESAAPPADAGRGGESAAPSAGAGTGGEFAIPIEDDLSTDSFWLR